MGGWHREESDRYVDDKGEFWSKPEDGFYRVYRNPNESWTGQGLPPVGTVCECQNDAFKWLQGVIVHVGTDRGKKIAIMQCENEMLWGESGEFRPIRTPEQIAAEDRSNAVCEMVRIWNIPPTGPEFYRALDRAELIYDAGYRKTEAGK